MAQRFRDCLGSSCVFLLQKEGVPVSLESFPAIRRRGPENERFLLQEWLYSQGFRLVMRRAQENVPDGFYIAWGPSTRSHMRYQSVVAEGGAGVYDPMGFNGATLEEQTHHITLEPLTPMWRLRLRIAFLLDRFGIKVLKLYFGDDK